ncbi:MAG: galactitol-1-phosphate 5-dehydrogenase [Desulfobacterales bacterium]|nr:MAG: galactitol-1-phosphate 5-dehydrogenase [Desulfobacterales bacterium]
MKTMKAANLYAPGDLRVEAVPMPEPAAGEVLVKVKACGVCGSDISRVMETGTYHFPTIPGHEFAGEVVELGPGVAGITPGSRVTVVPLIPCKACQYCGIGAYHLCEHYSYLGSRADGAFAEYVKGPAANLLPLPEGVDFALGAMTDPAAVALHAIRKLGIDAGDRLAVFGVGPIGAFALQWAKIVGVRETIAVDIFPEKLQIAHDLGADLCVDGSQDDPLGVIQEHTGGTGVERALEFAGHPVTQEQSILATAKRGACVWGGISHQGLNLSAKAVDAILRKEMTITGSWNSSFAPLVSDWEKTLIYMGQGKITAGNIISHRLALEAIRETFAMMLARKQYFNKVMFFPEM